MSNLKLLGEEIEQEYRLYKSDTQRDLNSLFSKVSEYIRPTIAMMVKKGSYLDEDSVEELTQDVMLTLVSGGLQKFQEGNAHFATYCTKIAMNKAIDWGRKWTRRAEAFYEGDEELHVYVESKLSAESLQLTPEQEYIKGEFVSEQYEAMKKYLNILVNQSGKPYRTLGCCYTMVLYNLIYMDSKELSSPKWAFDVMKDYDMQENADSFMDEFHKRMPHVELEWGDDFLDGMDEQEKGIYISEMIFGEHFTKKDLENWTLRFRQKMRRELFEEVCVL